MTATTPMNKNHRVEPHVAGLRAPHPLRRPLHKQANAIYRTVDNAEVKWLAEQFANRVEAALDDAVVEIIVQEIPVNAVGEEGRQPVEGLLDYSGVNLVPIETRVGQTEKRSRAARPLPAGRDSR